MMRSRLEKQLSQLEHEMIEMGALCEEVIAMAATALTRGDTALAASVIPRGREIDQKEREIEALCMRLLLR